MRGAQDLYEALAPPKGSTPDDFRISRAALPARVEELREQTHALRDHLAELRQPFTPAHVGQLVEQSQKLEADAALAAEIEGLLATPFLQADDRAALWTAGRALARRLNDETLAIDRQETATSASADEESSPGATEEPSPGEEAALRRARRSIELLALAGFDLPRPEKSPIEDRPLTTEALAATVRRLSDADASPGLRYQLANDLQRAWSEVLPARFNQARDLSARDRLSRLAPPFDPWPPVDEVKDQPTIRWRAELARNLWKWLAERATYEGRDLDKLPPCIPKRPGSCAACSSPRPPRRARHRAGCGNRSAWNLPPRPPPPR